jgi:hypothetical protein
MAVAKDQMALVGLKTQAERDAEDADKAARREARALRRHRLMSAIRTFARGQTEQLAAELSEDLEAFGVDSGKQGISGTLLRACMTGGERNYFRLDFLFLLLEESPEVAEIMVEACGYIQPQKTPEQYAKDLEKQFFKKLSPAEAEKAIRAAKEMPVEGPDGKPVRSAGGKP